MSVKPMTVKDLIAILKKYPKNLPVCYEMCSEQLLLEEQDIKVAPLCLPREDGWVADARPDKPTQNYLVFPGN